MPAIATSHVDDTHPPPTSIDAGVHETTRRSERLELPPPPANVIVAVRRAVADRDVRRMPRKARSLEHDAPLHVLIGSTGCIVVRAVM